MSFTVLNKFVIVMPICDDNLNILKVSSYLFDKFWPNETRIKIIGYRKPDFKISNKMQFISISEKQNGGANSWSKYLNKYLINCEKDVVLLTLEDYLPTKKPNLFLLEKIVDLMENKKVGRFDLTFDTNNQGKYKVLKDLKIFKIVESIAGTPYRISTQPSFWGKEYLQKILSLSTTPWDFEVAGSKRSGHFPEKVLAISDSSYYNYPTAWIHKGAISRQLPGKFNVLGLDLKTIKELSNLEFVQEENMVWGMWRNGHVPSFCELGGYNFDPRRMPKNEASLTDWREYYNVYGIKNEKK